jgi:hypothetical protein
MAGVGLTPCRAMAAEDIRDLQSWTRHKRRVSAGRLNLLELERDVLQRAHHLLDRLGGNPGIERRAIKLGVTEQNLDHADIDVLLQEMGGEAVPQRVQRYIALDPGRLCGGVAGSIELARGHRLHRRPGKSQPWGRVARHQMRSNSSRLGHRLSPLCSGRVMRRSTTRRMESSGGYAVERYFFAAESFCRRPSSRGREAINSPRKT